MPGALQSKGDGEYPYSAPFTGLNLSIPSIFLPPAAQEAQCSPSFSIVRGSIAAPWPYALNNLFGSSPGTGEYFLFATASGYIVTNLKIYQIQQGVGHWSLQETASMPSGAFPATGNQLPAAFVEANGCLYFSCQLGIYRFSTTNGLEAWSVAFAANFITISNQRMIAVGTSAVTENTTPGTPSGSGGSGSLAAGTYYAVVTAVFPSGTEGPPSAEGSFTLVSAGSIEWTWTAVSGASSYNVYIGTASGEENTVANVSTNSYDQTSYTAGTASPPVMPPFSAWAIAWSTVSDFSDTSVGSFNSNPNTTNGVVGGYDVLTSYSQGIPVGIINLGHSFYVQMTQGIVEVDPAQNGTSAFTLYNYWQENIPVGAIQGTVAQYGPISAFVTPDNVDIWIPGNQTQIGTPVMPLIRNIFRNTTMQVLSDLPVIEPPIVQNPSVNATFLVIYGELHYVLEFNIYGIPPQQFAPPYPNQIGAPEWFGLILDYNFASQSWSQQVTPPLTTQIYQVNGPPLTTTSPPEMPQQNFLIAGTQANASSAPGWIVFAPDVFNQLAWNGVQCQGLESQPQQCQVGFPQTPISAGHRPANRRVRVEYSMDEMSCATQTGAVDLTVSLQGTITQNTGASGGNGVATTTIQTISKTIQIQPPGAIAASSGNPVVPFLTATAYADMVLSCENPQVSLSWTDPSAHQRLMIHRVTLCCNDTKATMQ